MESILDAGYKGPVYPVNPNLSEVLGRRTYPSIRDLPETVELAFVVTRSVTASPPASKASS